MQTKMELFIYTEVLLQDAQGIAEVLLLILRRGHCDDGGAASAGAGSGKMQVQCTVYVLF